VARQVKLAEELGYETAWITDSHLVCRELWVTLAACALATSRIKLGPGVTVPHTRHFSVTASAIATLEDLAPGRVVLGIGTGGSSAETMGLSVQRAARVATLEAVVEGVRRLVSRGSVKLDSGVEARLAWLDTPRAVPIYVAGSGPKMLRAAGRLGDGAIMYAGVAPEILSAAESSRMSTSCSGCPRPSAATVRRHAITCAAASPPPCVILCPWTCPRKIRRRSGGCGTRMTRTSTRQRCPGIASSCPTGSSTSSRSPARRRKSVSRRAG
jgi:alkanesulfonate monooxygenase SsuD/methylene tetrahydromethanopterin reductase-like flavin-dependent oxidoreductase (luciferase family)